VVARVPNTIRLAGRRRFLLVVPVAEATNLFITRTTTARRTRLSEVVPTILLELLLSSTSRVERRRWIGCCRRARGIPVELLRSTPNGRDLRASARKREQRRDRDGRDKKTATNHAMLVHGEQRNVPPGPRSRNWNFCRTDAKRRSFERRFVKPEDYGLEELVVVVLVLLRIRDLRLVERRSLQTNRAE
jgi:hypothetical protein